MNPALVLPYLYDYALDPLWTAVDFLSDVHLRPGDQATFRAWAQHLATTPAQAVFLLGDLFELWVGDDMASGEFESECLEVLATAAERVTLAFMPGNRDFLLGAGFRNRTGALGLSDPTRLEAWGQRILLTHGDLLCIDDAPYQAFRQRVRGEAWQQSFLAQPLSERLAQAQQMRQGSMAQAAYRREHHGTALTDLDTAAAVAWMHQAGCRTLIHGHTHQPGTEVIAPGYTRHVLSDWDANGATPRLEVLRLSRDGLRRVPVTRPS